MSEDYGIYPPNWLKIHIALSRCVLKDQKKKQNELSTSLMIWGLEGMNRNSDCVIKWVQTNLSDPGLTAWTIHLNSLLCLSPVVMPKDVVFRSSLQSTPMKPAIQSTVY